MATVASGREYDTYKAGTAQENPLLQVALMYGLDKAGIMDFKDPKLRESISKNGLMGHYGNQIANQMFNSPDTTNTSRSITGSAEPPVGVNVPAVAPPIIQAQAPVAVTPPPEEPNVAPAPVPAPDNSVPQRKGANGNNDSGGGSGLMSMLGDDFLDAGIDAFMALI